MEQIEIVIRKHLSTIQTPKGNIYNIINNDIQCSSSVSEAWNSLIPGDSCWKTDLLNEVVRLWTTIRVHAFASGWAEQFKSDAKKGTRKTLKSK